MPDSPANLRVLFLAPSFLSRRAHKPVRGVEIFDLHLLDQLSRRGIQLTVPAERYWNRVFAERIPQATFDTFFFPGPRKCGIPGIISAIALRRRPFDLIVLGNNARGLLWGLPLLRPKKRGTRILVLAHRGTREDFLDAVHDYDMEVIAVSDLVAETFRANGREPRRLETYYGIPNADVFPPPPDGHRLSDRDGIVRFGVLGKLDSPQKGADEAIAAYLALPDAVRHRAELHLASYVSPPTDAPAGVVMHPWIPTPETPAFLHTLDVYVASSKIQETFGQSVVQAMLTGLPIIATPLRAHVEKLDDGGGIIVDDVEAMTDAMQHMILNSDERKRTGERAMQTARDRYVWDADVFIERYLRSASPSASEPRVEAVANG
ncbi:MAG: glycosyltransferase family 4 protein [Planctomycetota bacterium]